MEDGWGGNPHYDNEWSNDAPGWPGESEINNHNDGGENSDTWYRKRRQKKFKYKIKPSYEESAF